MDDEGENPTQQVQPDPPQVSVWADFLGDERGAVFKVVAPYLHCANFHWVEMFAFAILGGAVGFCAGADPSPCFPAV